jgi:hypothetical protein
MNGEASIMQLRKLGAENNLFLETSVARYSLSSKNAASSNANNMLSESADPYLERRFGPDEAMPCNFSKWPSIDVPVLC